MRKELVIRGQTASGNQRILEFGGYKEGYAYRLVDFQLWPSENLAGSTIELAATITAAKTYEDPSNPNFNNEGLIGTAYVSFSNHTYAPNHILSNNICNDTFLITQNLILAVIDSVAGSPKAVNWQCRFVSHKMSPGEEAATNFKQFQVSDGS